MDKLDYVFPKDIKVTFEFGYQKIEHKDYKDVCVVEWKTIDDISWWDCIYIDINDFFMNHDILCAILLISGILFIINTIAQMVWSM